MSGNVGFLFYHEFYDKYKNEDWREILTKKKSSDIQLTDQTIAHITSVNTKILESPIKPMKIEFPALSFRLTTTYPGLLLGTGYHHETGVEGEFKIGFYFDYTTGLPVIPGSSVKGALRSVFPNRKNKKLTAEYKEQRTAYIRETLNGLGVEGAESMDIDALELEIFEGIKNKDAKKAGDKYLPLYERDIFHDAFPVGVGTDGLFSDDFITPHKNPLKNPTPLKFLKVSPGVTFQFNFDLKDSTCCHITRADKLKLFLSILLDMGIGAKTNVGYGQFRGGNEIETNHLAISAEDRQETIQEVEPPPVPDEHFVRSKLSSIKKQYNPGLWQEIAKSGYIKKVSGKEYSARKPQYALPFLKILENGKGLEILYQWQNFFCKVVVELKNIQSQPEAFYVWNHKIKPYLEEIKKS